VLSSPGTRVWLRQPEQKLDDPGDPVTRSFGDYWMPAFAGMTDELDRAGSGEGLFEKRAAELQAGRVDAMA
jgi:hypothetical protein